MFSDLPVLMHELFDVVYPFHPELLLFFLAVLVRQFFLGASAPRLPSKVSACREGSKNPGTAAKPSEQSLVRATRAAASRGDLSAVFELARSSATAGSARSGAPLLLSVALRACASNKMPRQANSILVEMQALGYADQSSYRSVMKAWLDADNFNSAHEVLRSMSSTPIRASASMYNELLSHLTKPPDGQRLTPRVASLRGSNCTTQQARSIVEDMREASVSPNRITASIVLKTLGARSPHPDIAYAMQLVDSLEESVDEGLVSSVIEACVRIGRVPLIREKLALLRSLGAPAGTTAATCGTLIKAYGCVRDVEGVWRVWNDMRSRGLRLSSITIGCMVEAVVSNGDVDGGRELITSLLKEEGSRDQINSIIFGSVLKGYSHAGRTDTMWSVFREMTSHGIQPSAVTFNTLVDACARGGKMQGIPDLLEAMRRRGHPPNLITYSTIIKGFCGTGDVAAAVGTLDRMRRDTRIEPDEIVYNTLIDGCVQASMTSEAERLFEEMCDAGIVPTNYTITRMVKVLGQARRVACAFLLANKARRRYRLKFNAYVYNALMHTATASRDFDRAISALKDMEVAGFTPEARSVQALIVALINAGRPDEAVRILTSRVDDRQQTHSNQVGVAGRKRRGVFAEQHQQQHEDDDVFFARGFLDRVFKLLNEAGPEGSACSTKLSEELKMAGRAISTT